MEFIPLKKLPPDIELSQNIKERAEAFFKIQYLGHYYYIPVTKELSRILKKLGIIAKDGTKSFDNEQLIEIFIRDLIASVYLQIRDTVGTEIYATLSGEIKTGLEQMFSSRLSGTVTEKLNQKLLGE